MAFDAGSGGNAVHEVLIIGSGFAGLGMAIKLREAGITDFVVLERGDSVGGTWRDNRYPGCACDVQSHLYSFSFEPNPEWTRMFAPQPEIRAYLEHCTDKYALRPHIRLNQNVTQARWDEDARLWRVRTEAGDTYAGRILVSGMGGLSNPAYPDIDGLTRFKGPMFHSAEWDYDVDLKGKRVAVIGTGASAVQFVPKIAPEAAHVDLFQRSAPWIMPKPDRQITALERAAFRRLPALQQARRAALYWQLEGRILGFALDPRLMKLPEAMARRHIRKQIKDPVLREKVTPTYAFGCKRVLISNDYYPALARDNVDVVTDDIASVTATGVRMASGELRKADVIILGTGFKVQDPLPRGAIFGRDGLDILDTWPNGPEAYKGVAVAGFPNLFMLVGPNSGLGHNSMVFMIESQVAYVMDAIRRMRAQKLAAIEVRREVQDEYNATLQATTADTVWTSGCRSWYLDANGKNTALWPGSTVAYRLMTRRIRLADYRLTPVAEAQTA
jgi:cation diffusion facilitator CzcD-associated flavoprotein CzcO